MLNDSEAFSGKYVFEKAFLIKNETDSYNSAEYLVDGFWIMDNSI